MKNAIPHLYAEYGRYSDAFRAIPYIYDCLKPVERRLLYTLWSLARSTKTIKSARIIGELVGKYHPHGDGSAYATLVRMVRLNFAIGQGNWGADQYDEISAAAFRYTEVKSNPLIVKIGFEFIKFVDFHDPENLGYEQPLFLPCPVPIGLIGDRFISGISFNTTMLPRYKIEDLISRLKYLLQKEHDPNTQPVTIIPNFEHCDVYESMPGEFEKILTVGVGNIYVIPKMDIQSDGVHILGFPVDRFASLASNTENLKKPQQRKYFVVDGTTHGILDVVCIPKDGVVDQEFIDLIFNIIKQQVKFKCNVVIPDQTVELKSIDNLIKSSYGLWYQAYERQLMSQKHDLLEKLFELTVISVVQQILQDFKIKSKVDLIQIYETNPAYQVPNIGSINIDDVCKRYTIDALLNHSVSSIKHQTQLNVVDLTLSNMYNSAYLKMDGLLS